MPELPQPSPDDPRSSGSGSAARSAQAAEAGELAYGGSRWSRRRTWTAFQANRTAMAAFCALCLLMVAAVAGPMLYGQSATQADIFSLTPDAWPGTAGHLLGTDKDGIDILARLLAGLRVSIGVAVCVELLNVLLGVPIGLAAGYYGGAVDFALSRVADALFAFPGLLLAILVAGVFGPGIGEAGGGLGRLALVSGSLALVSWPLMARYVRAEVLSLRERDYVEAARAAGASTTRILLAHIAPNVFGLILTVTTLDMASQVVNEATLSLLGLGVQPPSASIGLMISNAIGVLNVNWTESLFPGLALTLLVLSFSFVGDGLREAFDPRQTR
jgi:oligopeptide transport system permease protein